MSAFEKGLAVLFANADLAKPATYYAGGAGIGAAIRVIVKSPDAVMNYGAARLVVDSVLADVRVSDVPALAAGDEIEFDTVRYVVQGDPQRDALRMVWTAELVAV